MTLDKVIHAIFICLVVILIPCDSRAQTASHKLNVSDPMPEFSVVDSQGLEFHYDPTANTVLLVAFFSPQKAQSVKAISDIEEVLMSLHKISHELAFLAVSDDPNSINTIKIKSTKQRAVYFIKDSDFKLWGKFGVIASPTVFIAGISGMVELVKAGYSYDFAPAIKSKLQAIMGLVPEKGTDVRQVKTVTNDSVEEKADRHLKMAQMLEKAGSLDAALAQLKMAHQIDPNHMGCLLELGRLYCMVSDPNHAIDSVEALKPADKGHQALRMFVLGKAYGQLKDYSNAEKYLLKAIALEPKSSQVFYELGRIYQLQNRKDKALDSYRKSLDLIYSHTN
jgi:tetratricopeptide (TPR) repeat protein